jgi:phosphoribosylamine--glycine ligase
LEVPQPRPILCYPQTNITSTPAAGPISLLSGLTCPLVATYLSVAPPMKVLVIGSGGREHALAWKLRQSPRVRELHCAPGNPGMAQIATLHRVDVHNLESLTALGQELRPDLTVVGPEAPLALGIVDEFQRRKLPIFGPTKAAATLESSKVFAKEFMMRHHIPTAHYAICANDAQVRDALGHLHSPFVVKADGLAAGKGVVIAQTKEETTSVAGQMLSGTFVGTAGKRVIIEEYLDGEELSFLVLSDGERVAPLAPARDHKRIGDNDTGPNTGGMGAYSTARLLDGPTTEWLLKHIARPVIEGMRAEDTEFRGVLYCGLMMTARGPMVLEFNCRFGDPETQPILVRLDSDLVDALESSITGHVSEGDFRWSQDASCCVVLASAGYPGKAESGKPISGLETAAQVPGVQVFHAGTAQQDGHVLTAGGRVLGVTGRGQDLTQAAARAYEAVSRIHFDGMQYRHDIGARAAAK